jgi:hypothetical protein
MKTTNRGAETLTTAWKLAGLEQLEREMAEQGETEDLRAAWQRARESLRASDPDALWARENR